MATVVSAVRRLNTCPVLIGVILEYLVEEIIAYYDLESFMILQQAVNATWAAETRRLMKKSLQRIQVHQFLSGTKFPAVSMVHNPVFLTVFNPDDLAVIHCRADLSQAHQQHGLCKFIATYMCNTKERNTSNNCAPQYPLVCNSGVLRGIPFSKRFEEYLGGADTGYILLKDVEFFKSSRDLHQYDFASVHMRGGSRGCTAVLVSIQKGVPNSCMIVSLNEDGQLLDETVTFVHDQGQ